MDSSPGIKNSNLFIHRRSGILFSGTKPSCSLRISNQNSDTTKNLYQKEGLKLLGFLQGIRNLSTPKAAADNCHYHATDGSVGLRTIPQKSDEVSKVLIPGLPNESDGNNGPPINSDFWEWKPNLSVHYEISGVENVGAPNVLFLPGFGVGTFHYEKQLKDLGREYKVWTLDFLGQGMSLPLEDPTPSNMQRSSSEEGEMAWGFGDESQPWANELAYSIDLWQEQVQDFVEQVLFANCRDYTNIELTCTICTKDRLIR